MGCVCRRVRWRYTFTAHFSTLDDVRRRVFSSNAGWGGRIYSSQVRTAKEASVESELCTLGALGSELIV